CRVPVKLVVAGEVSNLARSAILEHVLVWTKAQRAVGIADANPHALLHTFCTPDFRCAVAHHRLHAEADIDMRAVGARVDCRKIPQNAAADRYALGLHADRLGDRKIAIALHYDIADKQQNALDRAGRNARSKKDKKCTGELAHGAHGVWCATVSISG